MRLEDKKIEQYFKESSAPTERRKGLGKGTRALPGASGAGAWGRVGGGLPRQSGAAARVPGQEADDSARREGEGPAACPAPQCREEQSGGGSARGARQEAGGKPANQPAMFSRGRDGGDRRGPCPREGTRAEGGGRGAPQGLRRAAGRGGAGPSLTCCTPRKS